MSRERWTVGDYKDWIEWSLYGVFPGVGYVLAYKALRGTLQHPAENDSPARPVTDAEKFGVITGVLLQSAYLAVVAIKAISTF